MKTSAKNRVIALGSAIALMGLFSFNVQASEAENASKSKKAPATAATVNIEVVDMYGQVKYTDKVTASDTHIDFDLQSLPVGEYTVAVKVGDKVVNYTSMQNVSSDPNVITVEVLNAAGEQVFEAVGGNSNFDLSNMAAGTYTVNVYRGSLLINSSEVVN